MPWYLLGRTDTPGELGRIRAGSVTHALYDKRTSAHGVLAGILTGVLGIVGVWAFYLRESGGHVSWEALPVFLGSMAVTFSLRAPQQSNEAGSSKGLR